MLLIPAKEPYKTIFRFAPVMVEIASAKTSDDVADALQKGAEPLGSWRMRRNKTVWGVSARFGAGGGAEWVMNIKNAQTTNNDEIHRSYTAGLWAPVGLDVSGHLGDGWVLGGMVQVIDVGNLASARLNSNEAKTQPNVNFLQVLAPGANLFLGLGNSPFVFSPGFSWVPHLRDAKNESDDTKSKNVFRFTFNLGVDIPILMY